MNQQTPQNALWEFLEKEGVLDKADPKALEAAKRKYKTHYQREYRRKRRKQRPEFNVSFSADDIVLITREAVRHSLSVTAYIQKATVAYLQKEYLVPNHKEVAQLEQHLSRIHSDIQLIANSHSTNLLSQTLDYRKLLQRVAQAEQYVTDTLRHPKVIEEIVMQTVAEQPEVRTLLTKLFKNLL